MAEFEYGGGSGDLGGGNDGFMGYDPRDQRFDSSQRFDESFRAPDRFHPGFEDGGQQKEDEVEDHFKGSNGFSYHQADAPPSYGESFEEEASGQPTGGASGLNRSFEPDLHSEFEQGGDYTPAPGANGNGFGADAEDDGLFSSVPQDSTDGPILPPPEEMKEEGIALREWKRDNAMRLQEKERKEKERLAEIIEEADSYKDGVHEKRKGVIENGKKENRDKEKTFLSNHEHFHKNAEKHYWKAVAEIIPNELPTVAKKDRKEKKTGIVAIKGPKPGKPTDMTRLRQILVKLKHSPPAHMKYQPPPPPAAEKDKDKDKEKDKDKATDKDGKDKKDAKPVEATGSTTGSSGPSAPSGVAATTA